MVVRAVMEGAQRIVNLEDVPDSARGERGRGWLPAGGKLVLFFF